MAILSFTCLTLVCPDAKAQSTLIYRTNDLSISPTNVIGSNVLAGTNLYIERGARGQLTFNTVSAGEGTNSRQWGTLSLTNLGALASFYFTNGQASSMVLSNLAGNPFTGYTNPLAGVSLPMAMARLPATNYPTYASGYRGTELWYSRTNFEGSAVAVSASWQAVLPPDYSSNTLSVVLHSTITATNGPNSSNVVWRANVAAFPTGSTNDFRLWGGGAQVSGTTTWTASATGTNQVQATTISMAGNTDRAQAGSLVVIAVDRAVGTDTYVGAAALVGVELRYTRQ